MQYYSIPEQPGIVMWMSDDDASGIIRPGEAGWDDYEAWCQSQGYHDAPSLPVPEIPLSTALQQVRVEAERVLATYWSGYPSGEVESWGQQVTEATAWQADRSAPTPLLMAILQPEEDLQALCEKVLTNAAAYQQAVAEVIQWRRSASQTLSALFAQGPVSHVVIRYQEVPYAS